MALRGRTIDRTTLLTAGMKLQRDLELEQYQAVRDTASFEKAYDVPL